MGQEPLLDQASLDRAVADAGIDVPPRFFAEVPSTSTIALELAADGAPEWTVVAAGHQSAGRGRLGRSWVDAPGKALAVSMILRPPVPPDRGPLVPLLAAWAMVGAISLPAVRAKWPNDLMAGERKLGGILAEGRVEGGELDHVVLGVGINVAMGEEDFPPDLRATATSLALEGADTDDAALLTRFLSALRGAWPPDDHDVAERYQRVCATIGRRVRATTTSGARVEGMATGISSTGALIVEGEEGEHVVAFGEVAHLE
ncbi:MAG TPA: biotin--[acetyl-CoA-carboxylase] ligase [Actinomycetota bacterium]|nr:biotin--[acetyl-CoA-carboxylase] ligase [Actinomycetota bacterium]